MIFYMPGISYIDLHFRAPSPLKPLKSRPQGQNLPGFLLRAHSEHRGPVLTPFCPLSRNFLTSVSFISLSWVLQKHVLTSQIDRKLKVNLICLIHVFLSHFKCSVMKKQSSVFLFFVFLLLFCFCFVFFYDVLF